MPYYKFTKNDVFYNTLETKPLVQFDVNDSKVYLNKRNAISGAFTDNITHVPVGHTNLYEINVDRPENSLIFPFITKDGSFEVPQGISKADYNSIFEYGDQISGSYPLSASISRERFAANHGINNPTGSHVLALKNTLNYYTSLSPHYAFSSNLGDKSIQEISLIYVPSIFYGTTIDRGTVDLKFFISGTLIARAQDLYHNGQLIQTTGTILAQTNGSNKTAGVVLYNEGVFLLTGSWDLDARTYNLGAGSAERPSWITFAAGANDASATVSPSASFSIEFNGIKKVQTLTMFAHANKNELNFSTNKTYLNYLSASTMSPITSSNQYTENKDIPLINTVSSSFHNYEKKFKHQTFINKIGIYDEKKNLIAIANVATPIKKTAERDFTFKLKLDI
tara:strand:- start:463 stop:1644 length:1182 start_codon:yes stop_codon:yes gene_type:complete